MCPTMILWESEKNLWKTMWVLGIKLMETWKQAPLHMEPLSGLEYIIFIFRLTPSFLTFQHSHRPKLFCITFSNVLACTCILYILFQMTSYPSIMSLGSLYVWSVLIVIKWTSAYPDTQGTCGFQTFSIHYEMFAYLEFCSYRAHFRGWSFLFNR